MPDPTAPLPPDLARRLNAGPPIIVSEACPVCGGEGFVALTDHAEGDVAVCLGCRANEGERDDRRQ